MSHYESAKQFNIRATLFQHDMDSNEGEQYAWEETGTPDWTTSDYWVTLDNAEAIRSVQAFRYGVLTVNARASDWSVVILGFLDTLNENDAIFYLDNLHSEKHDTGAQTTAFALTDNTWYHFILIWCPQFVSLAAYNFDGSLEAYVVHRNPPNIQMDVFFQNFGVGAETFDVGGVTVQEGDSPEFYRVQRDNVNMWLMPSGGGSFTPHYGAAIRLTLVNHVCTAVGMIRRGFSRFRVNIYTTTHQNQYAWYDWYIAVQKCGDTPSAWTYSGTDLTPAGPARTTNYIYCFEHGWYPLSGLETRIGLACVSLTDWDFSILGIILEFE